LNFIEIGQKSFTLIEQVYRYSFLHWAAENLSLQEKEKDPSVSMGLVEWFSRLLDIQNFSIFRISRYSEFLDIQSFLIRFYILWLDIIA